jgi:hypothetical protein
MADAVEEGVDLMTLLLLAAGAFGIYWLWQKFNPSNPNTLPGAVTNDISSGIASIFEALTFGPPITATGTLASQSGQVLGPISSFPAATDSNGNTYLNVNGTVYQLGPRNAQGNFTAIPTGATASAGTATIPSQDMTASNTGSPGGTGGGGTGNTGNTYG